MSTNPPWLDNGSAHIWYPYTQMQTAPIPVAIKATKGSKLILEDDKELIDGIASWWSTCHGYNHPHIIKTVSKQLHAMPHVMFAGTAHEPALSLANRLAKVTGMDRVFFTDSGSTAVETAMKMAIQYWKNQGQKKRQKFVSFKNGYHGDTMGCMSLCDPDKGMHRAFNNYMPMQYCVDIPSDEYGFQELDALLRDLGHTAAGVIIEPLVQGAGGMKFHTADVLAELYRITKKYDLLFIADEIMTGFGRTGMMFAMQETGVLPDIMCVGKALTAGTMTMAAALTNSKVFDAFLSDNLEHALMNGPTFMANPLACSAAHASLDLFESEPRLKQIEAIEQQLYEQLLPCEKLNKVVDVRVKGAIGVVQLDTNWDEIFKLRQEFIKLGVWLRPFGDIVYIMPPFTISEKELTTLTDAVVKVLAKR